MGISVFDEEPLRWAINEGKSVKRQKSRCQKIYNEQLKYARQRAERGFCDRDLWNIDHWFLTLMPEMLKEYKKKRHGSPGCLGENYTNEDGTLVNDTCHEEWDKILDKMIFLFRECCEDTCSRKNPYEDEYLKAFAEFEKKYGFFGEKLETPKEKELNKNTGCHAFHSMSELPEYEEINRKYTEYNRELDEYREKCRIEAMELFTKWLPYLWD